MFMMIMRVVMIMGMFVVMRMPLRVSRSMWVRVHDVTVTVHMLMNNKFLFYVINEQHDAKNARAA